MWDQRLFTELKNLYPFPSTDVAKLGSTRKIGGFSVNLYREIRKREKSYNSLWFDTNNLILGQVIDKIEAKKMLEADFWNFHLFFIFGRFSGQFWGFS